MNISEKPKFAIFLDIDGVLYRSPGNAVREKVKELFPNVQPLKNYHYSVAASHFLHVKSVQNLHEIIEVIEKVYHVVIVITSNWRHNQSVDDLRGRIFGIHYFSKYIIGKTSNGVYGSRCKEIQAWLDEHPKIQKFIILDDIDDKLSTGFPEEFFQINRKELFSDEIKANILRKTLGVDGTIGADRKSPTKEVAINF